MDTDKAVIQGRIDVCQGTNKTKPCKWRLKNGTCKAAGGASIVDLVASGNCPKNKFPKNQLSSKAGDCGCKEKVLPRYRDPVSKSAKVEYQQPAGPLPPVVTSQGAPAGFLNGFYRGAPCFLVGGGPSLNGMNLKELNRRGILVAAMNNVAATHVRPQLWFSVDQQGLFHESIYRDPAIMAFTKAKHLPHTRKYGSIRRWNGMEWYNTGEAVRDYPNNWGYHHTADWTGNFLDDPLPSWGTSKAEKDPEGETFHKSVMLVSIWLLYWLGIREIYLLGCDFKMKAEGAYAFAENTSEDRAGKNRTLYGWLDRRFSELTNHFRDHNLSIVNCTPGSSLQAFPRLSFAEALSRCAVPPAQTVRGLYK